MSNSTAIMIAAHKQYQFPNDSGFIPLQVGKAVSEHGLGIQGDDTGENISSLNHFFCELTGLYWLWKNVDADYFGLSHYRRYFTSKKDKKALLIHGKTVACSEFLASNYNDNDVILSRKRRYIIDTVRSHYHHAHYASDLRLLEGVIVEKYPEYQAAFHCVMAQRSLSLYNMFFMNKTLFDDYMQFLFGVLLDLEQKIPYQNYGVYQRRVFGFLGERLLNIWVEKNRPKINIKYLSVVNIEGDGFVDKILGVLKRKYFGVKLD